MSGFKTGDTVRIKDGTPKTTTNRVGHEAQVEDDELHWDDGRKTGIGHYERSGLLELVPKPEGKFQPGDKVRVVGQGCYSLKADTEYVIESRNDYPGSGPNDDGIEGYTIVGDRLGLNDSMRRHPASEIQLIQSLPSDVTDEIVPGSFVMYTDELVNRTGSYRQHDKPEEVSKVEDWKVFYVRGGFDLKTNLRLATEEELAAMRTQDTENVLETAHEQASQYADERVQDMISLDDEDSWWEIEDDGSVLQPEAGEWIKQLGLEVRIQVRKA